MRISANLGFLFREHGLPDAIRAAKATGFDAVECHWPYEEDPAAIRAALAETGLAMLGLNTIRGHREGEVGLSALPGREADARAAIDQAIGYAQEIGCRNVHVMAGITDDAAAFDTFVGNLAHAARRAEEAGVDLLIEPLNRRDTPGYVLAHTDLAMTLIEAVGSDRLRIMFDCYHMQIMQGDLVSTIRALLPHIGHIQFAAVPDRTEPDAGEVDYGWLLPAIRDLGYEGWFGAEYRPERGDFAWLETFKARGI
ncbi:hydroxypyruvate isomerase family protein [Kaustia mangrovi]